MQGMPVLQWYWPQATTLNLCCKWEVHLKRVKEGDTVLDLCAGHQSMEGAAAQMGSRHVAVDRVAKLKRAKRREKAGQQ